MVLFYKSAYLTIYYVRLNNVFIISKKIKHIEHISLIIQTIAYL